MSMREYQLFTTTNSKRFADFLKEYIQYQGKQVKVFIGKGDCYNIYIKK